MNDGECRPSSGGALFFYAVLPPDFFSLPTTKINRNYTVNSRQLVTNSLDPNDATKWSLSHQEAGNVLCEPEVTTTTMSDEMTSVFSEITTTHIDEPATTTVPEVTTTITTTEVASEEISPTVDLVTAAVMTDDIIDTLESSIQLAIIKGGESLISQSQLLTLVFTP